MVKRKNPLTSHLAHESVKPSKAFMYIKIAEGLEKLRVGGTFDEIAEASKLRPEQVWKRLSEMHVSGIIFDTGITRKGKSGRLCGVWQLTSLPIKPIHITAKVAQGSLF